MTTGVRFYDSGVVDALDYYNNNVTSDGTTGKGRFVLTVDPFTAPSGTDGQFDEFDFVVDDPGDSTMVFWGWAGINVAASPTLVTGGFTFDTDTPSGFDYWGCRRVTKTSYDASVAAGLVAGATNYARNNATFYDGTYSIQGLGFVVPVDGASVASWWTNAPLPTHATPTFTAPTVGATFDTRFVSSLPLSFSDTAAFDHYQMRLLNGGTVVYDSGDLAATLATSASDAIPISYPHAATTIEVRVRDDTVTDWSAWATRAVSVLAPVDTPAACFSTDALADSPALLWLFREAATADGVADLSGNGRDGQFENQHWTDAYLDNTGAGSGVGGPFINGTIVVTGATPPTGGRMWVLLVSVQVSGAFTLDWASATAPGSVAAGFTLIEHRTVGTVEHYLLTRHHTGASDDAITIPFTGSAQRWAWALDESFRSSIDGWTGTSVVGPANTLSLTGPTWTDGIRRRLTLVGFLGSWHGPPTNGDYHSTGATPVNVLRYSAEDFPEVIGGSAFSSTDGVNAASDAAVWTVLLKRDVDSSPQTVPAETGICDSGCADANGSARFWTDNTIFPGHVRTDESDHLLSGATDFTIEAIARVVHGATGGVAGVTVGLNDFGPGTESAFVTGFHLYDASPNPKVDSPEVVGVTTRTVGCWNHVALVYTDSPVEALDRQRLYVNGVLVNRGSDTIDPTLLADGWFMAFGDTGGGDGVASLAAAAAYPTALPINRVVAHAAHLCACAGGQGFVLGHLTFN